MNSCNGFFKGSFKALVLMASLLTLSFAEPTAPLLDTLFQLIPNNALTSELKTTGCIERVGDDKELRPLFVNIQGQVEKCLFNLHNQNKISFFHATHTDLPSSPLCGINKNSTINRVAIMSGILKAGIPVYVIYSSDGLNRRSALEQKIYRNNVSHFNNLHDMPLPGQVSDADSGATIIATSKSNPNEKIFFSISALQSSRETKHWQLCLGNINNQQSKMLELLNKRRTFFTQNNFDVIKKELN